MLPLLLQIAYSCSHYNRIVYFAIHAIPPEKFYNIPLHIDIAISNIPQIRLPAGVYIHTNYSNFVHFIIIFNFHEHNNIS